MFFRRIISVFILVVFFCKSVSSQINLTQGLIAYYPFSGNANDVSGNNNNPIFNNATLTNDRNGNVNSAYHFNGFDNYMQIPNAPSLNMSNAISICTWVNVTGFYYGNCKGNSLLMKGDVEYQQGNYLLRFDDAIFNAGTSCSNPLPDTIHQSFRGVCANGSTNYIQKNKWHSVIYTYEGNYCKVYVDCKLQDSVLASGNTFTNVADLFFGKANLAGFPYWFNGDLDEVRIYNRAINFDEVLALNNLSKPEFTFTQNICNPKQLTLKNETINYTKYYWHFGNGTIDSTTTQPTVAYSNYGNYDIKLITTNNFGCNDTVAKSVTINISTDTTLITNTTDISICAGTAIKLNVSDTGVAYCWSVSNGVAPNISSPTVTPTSNTSYYYNAQILGNNLIVNGDFESGNTGFNSSYNYHPSTAGGVQGIYHIANNPSVWLSAFANCTDHTVGVGNDKMMMVDGSTQTNVPVWNETVNIQPNTNYAFSAWLTSIVSVNPAKLKFSINNTQVGKILQADTVNCKWNQFYVVWNSGNNTTANISIVNENTIVQGNDFALDDISFAPIKMQTDSIKINVNNCIVSSTCKGVIELNGGFKVKLPTPNKQYYSSSGFTWETWFNSSYYDNNNNSINPRNKLISALTIFPCEDIVLGFGWSVGAAKNQLCFVVDGPESSVLCNNRDKTPCVYKPSAGFVPNTWYHVAAVRDYTNNQSKLYVNGILVDTKTNNKAPITSDLDVFLSGVVIPFVDSGFAGKMDEIRIWNTTRTAAEIQANYNQCLSGNEAGLVAYYKANEKNGLTLKDATPNANNATLGSTINFDKTNNAPLIAACENTSFYIKDAIICQGQTYWGHTVSGTYKDTLINSNGCDSVRTLNLTVNNCIQSCKGVIELDGTNKVILPAAESKYYSTNGFTWETWFNGNSFDNNNNTIALRNTIMGAIDAVQCEDIFLGFGAFVNAPQNSLSFVVDGIGQCAKRDNNPCYYKPTAGFVANTWYHVAGVRDYVNNKTLLYLNGQLVDSKSNFNPPQTRNISTFLGKSTASTDSGFAGKLDEIRVWNYPRNANDIQTNYNKCLAGNETGLVVYYRATSKIAIVLKDASTNGNDGTIDATTIIDKTINAPLISNCQNATSRIENKSICQGQTYFGHSVSGTYKDTSTNSYGCDSITTLNLTIIYSTTTKDIIAGCTSLSFNGTVYKTDTLLTNNIKSYLGCDSIIQQHQIKITRIKDTITKAICILQTFWNHNTTGFYDSTFQLASGCDSVATLHLIVDKYIKDTTKVGVCFGEKYGNYQFNGIYYDTIKSATFCDTIKIINLTVRNRLNPKLGDDISICEGDTLQLYPGSFKNYLWSNGKTTSTISIKNIGEYWVQVSDTFGCKVSDTFHLISLNPLPNKFLQNPYLACLGEKSPILQNYLSYNWNTGETTATINLNGLNSYWVKVRDINSCAGSDTMKIIYLGDSKFSFVNTFSPNGDNINDVFKAIDAVCVSAYSINIFNRWGQLIYQSSNPANGWDGNYKGLPSPVGVYYYIINYKNVSGTDKRQTGSITLLR